jgi:hypothetical protein
MMASVFSIEYTINSDFKLHFFDPQRHRCSVFLTRTVKFFDCCPVVTASIPAVAGAKLEFGWLYSSPLHLFSFCCSRIRFLFIVKNIFQLIKHASRVSRYPYRSFAP